MNARARMIHRTTVERDRAYGTEIAPGNRADPEFRTHLTNLPCLYWQDAGSGEQHTPHRDAVMTSHRMILPRGVDLLERDQIHGIVDRDGTWIDRGVFAIEQLIIRRSHVLAILERPA